MKKHRIVLALQMDHGYHRDVYKGIRKYLSQDRSLEPVVQMGQILHPLGRLKYLNGDGILGYVTGRDKAEGTWQQKPTVSVSNQKAMDNFHVVCSQDQRVGELAAETLIECGMENFGCVSVWADYGSERITGFQRHLKKLGFQSIVYDRPNKEEKFQAHWQTIAQSIRDWFKGLPKPVGIYCSDDWQAMEIYRLSLEMGFHVPKDVSIVGTNNDELIFGLNEVGLTSIELDGQLIGFRSGEMAASMLKGTTGLTQRIEIPPIRVVQRQSTFIYHRRFPKVAEVLRRMYRKIGDDVLVEDLVKDLGLSRTHIERQFRQAIGRSIYDHLIYLRVEKGKELIRETNYTITEISRLCGFGDNRQFSSTFKKRTGLSPRSFRSAH